MSCREEILRGGHAARRAVFPARRWCSAGQPRDGGVGPSTYVPRHAAHRSNRNRARTHEAHAEWSGDTATEDSSGASSWFGLGGHSRASSCVIASHAGWRDRWCTSEDLPAAGAVTRSSNPSAPWRSHQRRRRPLAAVSRPWSPNSFLPFAANASGCVTTRASIRSSLMHPRSSPDGRDSDLPAEGPFCMPPDALTLPRRAVPGRGAARPHHLQGAQA
jgi:hypothetical protein